MLITLSLGLMDVSRASPDAAQLNVQANNLGMFPDRSQLTLSSAEWAESLKIVDTNSTEFL